MMAEATLRIDHLPEPTVFVGIDGRLLAANHAAREELHLDPGDADALLRRLDQPHETAIQFIRACHRTSGPVFGTMSLRESNGEAHRFRCEGGRIADDPDQPRAWLRFRRHDTAGAAFLALNQQLDQLSKEVRRRQLAEERLSALLKEKEILLFEIHHRVKNNLQVISSLIQNTIYDVPDATVENKLNALRNRVLAMGFVHNHLFDRGAATLPADAFIRDIAAHVLASYDRDDITLDLGVESISLPLERAMPVALIVNELIANSCKHAFPNRPGRIRIALDTLPDEMARLVVADDGNGWGDGGGNGGGDAPRRRSRAMGGLQLVEALAAQIGGRVERRHDQGITVSIHFPSSRWQRPA